MTDMSIYHVENGNCYIFVGNVAANREVQSLKLAIALGREKIEHIKQAMNSLADDTAEYDDLQDKLNDYEMMISDFEDRSNDLLNRPSK